MLANIFPDLPSDIAGSTNLRFLLSCHVHAAVWSKKLPSSPKMLEIFLSVSREWPNQPLQFLHLASLAHPFSLVILAVPLQGRDPEAKPYIGLSMIH